jgi:CRP-like cAMP-binding protein
MPNAQHLRPFLKKLTDRTILTDREQDAVLAITGTPEVIAPRQDFVGRGDDETTACLVVSGMCARMGQTISGERQITGFFRAGDFPNLHSVMVPSASSAIQAVVESRILRVRHADIRALAIAFPAIAEALWRDTVCDAATSAEWVVNVGRRSAKVRLAHLYCEMAIRAEAVSENAFEFDFPATQVILADATGLSAVHTNRSMQALKAIGVLEIRGKTALVRNWSMLMELAGFDQAYLHRNAPMRFAALN